jgi:hypothetical protein
MESPQAYSLVNARRNFVMALALAVIAINSYSFFFQDQATREFFGDMARPASSGAAAVAAILVVYRQKIAGLFGKAYASLSVGTALWFSAETIWAYYRLVLNIESPFPSIADGLFLLGYAFFGFHLFSMYRFYGVRITKRSKIIASAGAAIFAIIYSSFIIQSSDLSGPDWFVELAIGIAYPVFDLIILVPAVLIVLKVGKGQLTAIPWIFISWILTAIADALWGYAAVTNSLSQIWLSALVYNAAYLTMAGGILWYYQYFIFDKKKADRLWKGDKVNES